MQTYAPCAELADVVESFWRGRWDLRGQDPHETELIGDPCVHFVHERGSGNPGRRVVGVWTRLWTRTLAERGDVHGVKLKAGAVAAFVDRPAHALSNQILALDEVFGRAAEAFEAAVESGADDQARFAAIESWLLEHRRPPSDDQRLAMRLCAEATGDSAVMRVESWAATHGLTVRALQRLFRDHVGAPPKFVIRRARLQEAALRIERGTLTGSPAALAELAADLGYADQAHLTRDFKAVTGKTPGNFAKSLASPQPPPQP